MSLNAIKLKIKSTGGTKNLRLINNFLINNSLKSFSIYNSKASFAYNSHIQDNLLIKTKNAKYHYNNQQPLLKPKLIKIKTSFMHSSSDKLGGSAVNFRNNDSKQDDFATNDKDFYENFKTSNSANSTQKDQPSSIPKKELFGNNDIDAILAEVNEFFLSNSSKISKSASTEPTYSEDIIDNLNIVTKNFSNKSNSNQNQKPKTNINNNINNKANSEFNSNSNNSNMFKMNESQLLNLNNEKTNLSSLSEFFLNENELFEEDTAQNEKYEESIFGYKTENKSVPIEFVRKFPFIKKLLFVYKTVFYSQIQKLEHRFICQNIFDSDEFNLENLTEFQNNQPLEIKIAYYISFKALRGSPPIFLNKSIKNEIYKRMESRNLSLNDILVYSKLNINMQDINLMYRICDFLNPIFAKSITEVRYGDIVERNPENIYFFLNLFIILMPCQKFLNLILNKYESLYMNIFATLYNLRKYVFEGSDVSPLKSLLYILIKGNTNKKIKQSELYRKFQVLIDDLVNDYTDNYCSKILESTQFSNLVNYFTKYYSTLENLDDNMIKKILDINYLSINLMEKYSEEALLMLFRSIENFLHFFVNIKDKIEDKEELCAILEKIIFAYFTIYNPNIAISDSQLDFSKIKNMDLIYLIKLKYIFATYFHRTNAEASSYLVAISGLIDNSLNNITHYPVIYTVMGKCIKYTSIKDRNKFFEFYAKNIKTYLDDKNFFLFVHNYDMLEKYGDISAVVSDYRAFIIRQLIKMFYFNQVYYIFAKPDKLFYTIMAFCNNTYMVEFENSQRKSLKKTSKSGTAKNGESDKAYKSFENSYYPTFPKELYRFLNIIFYKIRTDAAIFNIYANRIQTMLNLVKLSYLFEPQLIKENYFSVLYPSINFFGMNYLDVATFVDDLNHLNIITYYISLLPDNKEMMINQLKLVAKFVVIANKITDTPEKMFFVLKKIEETYLLNPQPYDLLEKNPKNPKFMKLILRIKNKAYKSLRSVDNPSFSLRS